MTAPTDHRPAPWRAGPSAPLRGRVRVPGDKSVSHRAVIFGLLTPGETHVTGLLEGDDVLATIRVARALGAACERHGPGAWTIRGAGLGALRQPDQVLDFGNSGTSVRLMAGVLATHPITAHLTGDASLCKRPMERVLAPLRLMGARAEARDGRLPVYLVGAAEPRPIRYVLPVASAQVKSAVLLAGLNTPGTTIVVEPIATRDHTERMLTAFGARLEVSVDETGARVIALEGRPTLAPRPIDVPADPSSAAFPAVAALIVPGSDITVESVLMNPSRTGLYQTLQEMGADITFENERAAGGETVADIRVRASRLKGVTVPASRAPSMIDEYPVLAVAAAFAQGTTRMEGLDELRVKESDRLAAVEAGLKAIGAAARAGENWLEVDGAGPKGPPGGGPVATHMDHRIAMAFLTAGFAARGGTSVDDGAMIATSFPDYVELMRKLGAPLSSLNA